MSICKKCDRCGVLASYDAVQGWESVKRSSRPDQLPADLCVDCDGLLTRFLAGDALAPDPLVPTPIALVPPLPEGVLKLTTPEPVEFPNNFKYPSPVITRDPSLYCEGDGKSQPCGHLKSDHLTSGCLNKPDGIEFCRCMVSQGIKNPLKVCDL